MTTKPLNVLCIGAHPDDCDFQISGIALKYRALGHNVCFVSMTNGDAGHFEMGGGALAQRRYEETQAVAAAADLEYIVFDIHDGELEPTIEVRKRIISLMREKQAALVICHRSNDYHPDHRASGIAVQDAAYTVIVPNIVPFVPHVRRAPVVGYMYDNFTIPTPYIPHIAVDTDDVFERKVDLAHCHVSQVYEWLPYSEEKLEQVPPASDEPARRAWLAAGLRKRFEGVADDLRPALIRLYGEERGKAIKTAESISISEYGRQPAPEEYKTLFPFF
ncbi:MAG: PIG-L family deacetylase [Lentisphaerae bacterium]|nr:PIG-L family deacetylase [Lentisphaerota bacterium]